MKYLKKFENYGSIDTAKDVAERWDTEYNTDWYSRFIEVYPTYRTFQDELADELQGEEWYGEAEFHMIETQVGDMTEDMQGYYSDWLDDLIETEWGNERMSDKEWDLVHTGYFDENGNPIQEEE